MTQEEIIKLAHAAGFNWPDIQATTIEQRLERFASLVAAAEREKFTNTQEFVTLPREAVERALSAIEKAVLWDKARGFVAPYVVRDPLHAGINTLRAALEQPQNHVPDVGNMVQAGWMPVPVEPTEAMLDAGCEAVDGPDWTGPNSVYRAMLAAAPQAPAVEQHTDDAAVNRFAEAMKAKLAVARDKGRGGWDDPAQCTVEYLAKLLVDHIAKGDPIDVANFAMMLHQRQADKSVLSEAAPTPTAVDNPEPAYLLRDLADDISVDALDLIAEIRDAGLGNYSINMKLPTRVCVAMCQKFSDAQQPQVDPEPVTLLRFNTWSSNEGDSWYDCPTDAQIIEDVFGGETPMVGAEYEVSAGWRCVTATYRITWVSENGDCEAECISHPQENASSASTPRQPQVEQEPVAVVDFTTGGWRKIVDAMRTLPDGAQLYTHPQARREPLTHYEIHELFRRSWDYCQDGDEIKAFARAIEAAHNIK